MAGKMKYIALTGACILSCAMGISYAYLTDEDEVDNTLNLSKVETTIVEDYDPPSQIRPGSIIKKIPRIHSNSDIDCYVRASVVFTNDGQRFCEDLVIGDGWSLAEDGYYYWQYPLSPGEDTGNLFEQIVIRNEMDEKELDEFDLLIYSEAVQCGNDRADEAWASMDQKRKEE